MAILTILEVPDPRLRQKSTPVEAVTDEIRQLIADMLGNISIEATTVEIAKRLVEALAPRWLRIGGYWYPRGGIPIDVFWQTGAAPANLWLPEQGVPGYRGRG